MAKWVVFGVVIFSPALDGALIIAWSPGIGLTYAFHVIGAFEADRR
jgi:hypothetical protein